MDWPARYKIHLLRVLWPLLNNSNRTLTNAEKKSLWALLQQDEFINMKTLRLSRALPQVCLDIFKSL